jgi:hypothetical protein
LIQKISGHHLRTLPLKVFIGYFFLFIEEEAAIKALLLYSHVPITGCPITGKRRYLDRFVYVINSIYGRPVFQYV